MRLVNAINENRISMDSEIASKQYKHQKVKGQLTVLAEFADECSVVRFNEVAGGKKRLWTKKEMNSKLGHEGSMDITDACAMRYFPCLASEYGAELEYGVSHDDEEEDEYEYSPFKINIYDESNWC